MFILKIKYYKQCIIVGFCYSYLYVCMYVCAWFWCALVGASQAHSRRATSSATGRRDRRGAMAGDHRPGPAA